LASPTARAEGAEPEVGHVVGDVRGEELVHPLQLARVREVPVAVDQRGDVGAVAVGQRHRDALP
jgi:hypothetical protein